MDELKAYVPPAGKSFSLVGKTQDAAMRRDLNAVHRIRRGINIKPWEGLEMLEAILQETSLKAKGSERGEVLLSSPRVSPAMVERDVAQNTEFLQKSFLNATAVRMNLAEIPAVRATSPRAESPPPHSDDAASPQSNAGTPRKKKRRAERLHRSAPFMAPPRPRPGRELEGRAPDVGKYTPKYSVVERHSEAIMMPGTHKHRRRHAASPKSHAPDAKGSGDRSPNAASTFSLTQTRVDQVLTPSQSPLMPPTGSPSSPANDKGAPSPFALARGGSFRQPVKETPYEEYRKRRLRDVSGVFKAVGRAAEQSNTHDLDYWPFPRPGTTTYTLGKIAAGERVTIADRHLGCAPNISYFIKEKRRAKSVLAFDRCVTRDEMRDGLGRSNVEPPALDYQINIGSLSTKERTGKGTMQFDKRTGRPEMAPTRSASEGLSLYADSIATTKKVGYVEFGKQKPRDGMDSTLALYEAPELPDLSSSTTEVNTSLVERRTTAVVFTKAPGHAAADALMKRSSSPLNAEYKPNYSTVERHRPAVLMRATGRDSPILHEGKPTARTTDEDLDKGRWDRRRHVYTPTMAHQLSRDQRNTILEGKHNATDAIYDIPPPKVRGVTISRLKR